MTSKRWYVVTPEYEARSSSWYVEPPEWTADVVEVECEKRDAKVLGVILLRREYGNGWIADAECPFTGLKVYPHQLNEED